MTKWIRTLLIGGLLSYRALFDWITPWVLIPSFLVTPLAQILFFSYIGRTSGVESDSFFVVGNALQYSSIPCLFGMTNTIVLERFDNTLGLIFVSPASRLALVFGRALPVIINGFAVSMTSLIIASRVLDIEVGLSSLMSLVIVISVCSFACTGLGIVNAAIGLRFRDTAVVSNMLFGFLLIFSGANIPRSSLPGWMREIGNWIPMTRSIEAARRMVHGSELEDVAGLLGTEALIGICYTVCGLAMLRILEVGSRKAASLEVS